MKKIVLPLFLCMLTAVSCKKDDNDTKPNTPTTKDGFVWKEDGGAEITADSAFWTTWANGTGVRAFKGGMSNFFEVNWAGANSTSVTTYTLRSPYGLTFLKGSDTYVESGAASINITAFSNDKLSGNFNVAISGGSIKNVSATFTNIPKK